MPGLEKGLQNQADHGLVKGKDLSVPAAHPYQKIYSVNSHDNSVG